MGPSVSGKTTLLNKLLGSTDLKTAEVREKDSKGRHTTSRRQLTVLPEGGIIIDSPGMRELGHIDMAAGFSDTFEDIIVLSEQCKFSNCSHIHETGCRVLKALEDEEIAHERYDNFMKMEKESKFHKMSYLEKRKKDKKFGKMVKSVMKHKKNRR